MASRNLPPSFFNAHYHAKLAGYSEAKLAYSHPEASGLYSEAYTQGLHHLAAHASSPDPWQYAAQATATSSYHRSVQVCGNVYYSKIGTGWFLFDLISI